MDVIRPSALKRLLWMLLLVLMPAVAFAQDDGDGDEDEDEGDKVKVLQDPGKGSSPVIIDRDPPKRSDGTPTTTADPGDGAVDLSSEFGIDQNLGDDFEISTTPSNIKFNIDFYQADLADVVKWMSANTGRNFIIADSLRAGSKKITIISPKPVSTAEAYRAFLTALEMNGLTVVKSGKFYKIVDLSAGLTEVLETRMPGQRVPPEDALMTQLIELEFVDIAQLQPVLENLKTKTGRIIPYAPTNTLIITDTGNAIRRMMKIIDRLDQVGADAEKIWTYQVQYADAQELSGLLTSIFQTGGQNAQRGRPAANRNNQRGNQAAAAAVVSDVDVTVSQIVPDPRTNKLIIVANERSYERIKKLILKLDIELPDSGRVNVVHMENSDAQEVAQVLSDLISRVQPTDPRRPPTQQGGQQQTTGVVGGSGAMLQGEVSVVANEPTNDLIIVASPRDFLSLRTVIKELDRPRKQVYVEAVIMEVSLDRMRNLGMALHGGNIFEGDEGDSALVGRTDLGGLQSLSAGPLFLGAGSVPGLLAAFIGPSVVDIGPLSIPAFSLVLNTLQTNTDVNVLSEPWLLTLDNEEAEISIGERIPFISSTGGGANLAGLAGSLSGDLGGADLGQAAGLLGGGLGGLGLGTQVQRVDVALTLRIKPQINESGYVRLEVEEEIEEVKPGGVELGGPTTRRRNLKTVVVIKDQETVVLGGLMRDAENQSVAKIPLLGDIPVIGYLFRSTETQIQKQNLLLLLTPYIIESDSDLAKIRERKLKEREAFLEYFKTKDVDYVKSVNFDKKHGLLEEIRQTLTQAESEDTAIREAGGLYLPGREEGIDLPEGMDDGYGDDGGAGGGTETPLQPQPKKPTNPNTP